MKIQTSSLNRRDFLRVVGLSAVAIAGAPKLAMASTPLEEIRKRGYLLYGFNGERPYNYLDPDGSLIGSEIAIARAVAKQMGIDEVQGVAMNFDSFIPAIQADRIDTCLPIFVKPERCKIIQYSTPHLKEGQSCIVPAGNPKGIHGWDDLVGKDVKVGLIAGTTPNEIAANAGVDNSRITRFPDTTTLTAGMKSGRVDAIVEASGTIRLIFEELEGAGFERVVGWTKPSNTTGKIEFLAAFPFNAEATELRDAFDAELVKLLADGTVDSLTAEYGIGPADRPGANDPTLAEECAA
ncbi:MAG: transporter substrate-binding domain-containing protein [Gammaproteobacteria bacterium]|nr:transporter substrate-binding domain-containing protein [Gammaproteobacteria bacterium]